MGRNSYTALRRIATHPAFSLRSGTLVCPACPFETDRVREIEDHIVAHVDELVEADPERALRIAWVSLSGKRWDRERENRGWPTTEWMLENVERRG